MAKNPSVAVDISAVDHFTATMGRFRQELAKVKGPLLQMQQDAKPSVSSGSSGSMFGSMTNGLKDVQARARGAVGSVASIVPGLGVLGGVASAAGLTGLVSTFSGMGVGLETVAARAGTTARSMAGLQGAARAVGGSAETANSMMVGLNEALSNAAFGRSPEAVAAFQQLGIAFAEMTKGAIKAGTAGEKIDEVANAVQALIKNANGDVRPALQFLSKLGISADALPVLAQGADRLRELREEHERLSRVTEDGTAASRRFLGAQARMQSSAEGLARSITTALEPALTPMLNQLASWVDGHNDVIAEKIGKIGKGLERVATAAKDLLALFDRIRDAGAAIGADKLIPSRAEQQAALLERYNRLTAPTGQDPAGPQAQQPSAWSRFWSRITGQSSGASNPAAGLPVDKTAAARDSFTFWRSKGMTPAGAASMASMEIGESGGDVAARGDGGRSHGLYQHDPNRRAAILARTGIDLSTETDANKQREAVYQEMKQRLDEGAGRAYDRIGGTNDLQVGVESGVRDFERSSDQAGDIAKRLRIARDILRLYGKDSAEKADEPDLARGRVPVPAPAGPALPLPANTAGNDGRSRVAVDLTFNGAPDGMRHSATTEGDGVQVGSVRVRRAMAEQDWSRGY